MSSNKQKLLIFGGVALSVFLLLMYIDSQTSKMTQALRPGSNSPSANAPVESFSRNTPQPEEKAILKEDSYTTPSAPGQRPTTSSSTSSVGASDAPTRANETKRKATTEAASAAAKRKYSQAAAPASAPSTVTLSIKIEGDDPDAPWHLQSEDKLERVDFDPMTPYLTSAWITFMLLAGLLGRSAHGLWHVRRGDVLVHSKIEFALRDLRRALQKDPL